MQPFVAPAEQKIRNKLDEMLKKAWQKIQLEEPPQELPWPEGRVVLAVLIQPRTVKMTNFSKVEGSKFDSDSPPPPETTVPDFQIIFLAEMGSKVETTQKLVQRIAAQAVEDGFIRRRETVREVEINIFKKNQEDDENYDTLCYGFKDKWLIAGSSLKYIRQVLMRMEGSELNNLAEQEDFPGICKNLGDSDIFFYLNAHPLINVIRSTVPAEQRENFVQTIKTLGFENVGGLALAVQLVPSKIEEIRIKALLGVRGEKMGIPALLTPISVSTRGNRLLSRGLASFLVANYEISKMYDEIVRMVWDIGKVNIDGLLQGAMAATGQPDESSRPPVNLRQEVIGQLTIPITITTRIEKPYTDPDSSKTQMAIAVRNGEILDTALARIHNAFINQDNREMKRELLNCTIYLLPPIPFSGAFLGIPPNMAEDNTNKLEFAFAVVGDQFVFGTVRVVEQAIRNLRRENIDSIDSDTMYQYARRYLPAQAGVFYYENEQISGEMLWAMLKEATRQIAQQTKSPASKQNEWVLAFPVAGGPGSPLAPMMEQIKEYFDFATLPDFQMIRKYFGATVSYIVGTDQGIFAETIGLKAPSNIP